MKTRNKMLLAVAADTVIVYPSDALRDGSRIELPAGGR